MVLRCAWGTCNSDERYPERIAGLRFFRFPNPKHDLDKCRRWIRACGRPHEQINVARLNKHKAICSKHFHDGKGPSEECPDPLCADGSRCTPARKHCKRTAASAEHTAVRKTRKIVTTPSCSNTETDNVEPNPKTVLDEMEMITRLEHGVGTDQCQTQTEESWISPIDMLSLAAENHQLKSKITVLEEEVVKMRHELQGKDNIIKKLTDPVKKSKTLSVHIVKVKETKIKGLFKFYTGITYIRFAASLSFLIPGQSKINYESTRKDLKCVSNEDGLFFTLCRLRHAFELKDMAVRFGLSIQSAGVVFNTWLDRIYMQVGKYNIWPHRDTIIENMPKSYKKDFPTTLASIDCTEIKTQVPKAMRLQSQLYSNYKSCTTLKSLVACDPRGSLVFVSELFTGSISDKTITEECGFYEALKMLKSIGYIVDGDSLMADKGFNIGNELNELGLKINVPPFAATGSQMSVSDTQLTMKIAKHRVHIERLIRKVKTYNIVSTCVPTSLFKSVNRLWAVCCHLTLFQDVFVKDK